MKSVVIHHKDSDGYVSALIVKAVLLGKKSEKTDEIIFIPFNYYETLNIDFVKQADQCFILDISFSTEIMCDLKSHFGKNLVWIDHHKSAIQRLAQAGESFKGLQSTEEAACMLTWAYFYGVSTEAPLLVQAINRYDNWRKGEDWDSFIYPLNLCVMTLFKDVASVDVSILKDDDAVKQLVEGVGVYLSQFNDNIHSAEVKYLETRILDQNGKSFQVSVLNYTLHSSKTFDLYENKGNTANQVKIIYTNFGDKSKVSVYSDNSDFDCSQYASSFGGGGHANAAGFETLTSEFFASFK